MFAFSHFHIYRYLRKTSDALNDSSTLIQLKNGGVIFRLQSLKLFTRRVCDCALNLKLSVITKFAVNLLTFFAKSCIRVNMKYSKKLT